jgi:hypothetical protein
MTIMTATWNQNIDALIRNAPTIDEADLAIQKVFGISDTKEKLDVLIERFNIRPGTGCGLEGLSEAQILNSTYRAALATIVKH